MNDPNHTPIKDEPQDSGALPEQTKENAILETNPTPEENPIPEENPTPEEETVPEETAPPSEAQTSEEAPAAAAPRVDHLHGGNWKTERKLRRREHHDLKKRMNTKMLAVRVAIITTLLFLGASAIAGVLYFEMMRAEERYHEGNSDAAEKYSALLSEKEKLQASLADLKEEREVLQKRLEDLDAELSAVKAERDDLMENNNVILLLQEKIAGLEAAIADKDAKIAELEAAVNRPELNLSPMLSKLQAVQTLLESGAPLQNVKVEKTDEFGNPYFEDAQVYPNLSLSVLDVKTGMSYHWESGKVYDSGELSRLIYALALLECATEEQEAREASEQEETLLYDLSAKYTLMKDDLSGGSGILQNESAGKVYTYLELIEIMLSYNDAIAYKILNRTFGEDPVARWRTKVPELTGRETLDKLSSSDLIVVLKRVHALASSDSPYAASLKRAMTSAVATYYSQATTDATAVGRYHSLTATHHHEIALRYDDSHTLLVVLMSDVATVTPEWVAFLTSLYQSVNDLMLAFRG